MNQATINPSSGAHLLGWLLCTAIALLHIGIKTQFDDHKSVAQVVFQRDLAWQVYLGKEENTA